MPLFKKLILRENRRAEISGFGTCLGVVVRGSDHMPCVHSDTFKFKGVLAEIFRLLASWNVLDQDFVYTSFQLLHNAKVDEHTDPNPTDSILFSCGAHVGGELEICGAPGSGSEIYDIRHQPLRFDGARSHRVLPFEGERWSVALYPHRHFNAISEDDQQFLLDVGFRPPSDGVPRALPGGGSSDQAPLRLAILEVGANLATPFASLKRIGYESKANAAELVSIGYESDAVANLTRSLPNATIVNATSAMDDETTAQKVAQPHGMNIFVAAEFGCAPSELQKAHDLQVILSAADVVAEKRVDAIAIALNPFYDLKEFISTVMETSPFVMHAYTIAPFSGQFWIWVRNEISWPEGTVCGKDFGGFPTLYPPTFMAPPVGFGSFLMKGGSQSEAILRHRLFPCARASTSYRRKMGSHGLCAPWRLKGS